ncbi:unnamed protein product [Hyaloperonospora brassicae]|uniref:Uncharacterized protein n=1 Tax=Hyaloperonospora brassicae TaxID=162125 RepID=A0AAV0T2E7_HYABA|nr:unnamed protein product [Hyaloperonospora brassicae]
MAVSGTLAVTVHKFAVDGAKSDAKYSVRLRVGDNEVQTNDASAGEAIDAPVHLNVTATSDAEQVTFEVLQTGHATPIGVSTRSLQEFLRGFDRRQMSFSVGDVSAPQTIVVTHSAQWTPSTSRSLTPAETHRPWFMRASYYYDTTKSVYDYTTSFRVVKPFARLGEATVNTVLAAVSGKTLTDVDQSLVVPVLNSVDNKVDATISVAFTKLYAGQQMVVRTKNRAVRAVSSVAHKTGSTVVGATSYTTHKAAQGAGVVVGGVVGVADYTSSQVRHASSSTFGLVRGVTYSVASHIPILGPKIRA